MLGRSAVVPSAGPTADVHPEVPTSPATTRCIHTTVGKDALLVVCVVFRNCAGCAVLIIVANIILAQGNYLSGQTPAVQSIASFTAAVVAHFCVFVGISLTSYQATGFQRLRFSDAPRSQPTWINCIVRIACECWRPWVLWSTGIVVCCYFIGNGGAWYVCKAKAHAYAALVGFQMFTITSDLAIRTIYQRDTVQGQATGHVNTRPYIVRFVQVQLRRPLVFVALILATGYVHLASRLIISPNHLLFFSACSFGLKVGLQEISKCFVLKHSGVDQRAVFLMAMLPTILVDTQLRVALLRFQSISGSFAGTTIAAYVGFAVAKSVVRLVKIALVRRELVRNHAQQVRADQILADEFMPRHGRRAWPPSDAKISSRHVTIYTHNLNLWKDRRLLFHAAEVVADMHAEYIAIACALSVHYFFGGHPKYPLPVVKFIWASTSDSADNGAQLSVSSLLTQLMLQVSVDLVCCTAELHHGIPLEKSTIPKLVVAVIIHTATLALCMCAIGYIDVD